MMNKKNNETTLTHLTKRFVKLLNANSERVVNLNEASTRLSVAKRRIYDITNVLEGIGLLQKTSKNVTRWVDCPRDSPFAAPPSANLNNKDQFNLLTTTPNGTTNATNHTTINNTVANGNHYPLTDTDQINNATDPATDLKSTLAGLNLNLNSLPDAELLALIETYRRLEQGANDLEANIREQLNADGAYVTYHDIKSSFNDQTVIAVKAPPETRLEVNENLQINIKSENGPIEVYLYQHNNSSSSNNSNNPSGQTTNQQIQNVYQAQQQQQQSASPHNHLQQQSQPNCNTHNATQPLDATFTNTNNLIGQQQTTTQVPSSNSVSSDEGRGRSIATTDGVYYDPTSGVSETDQYYNDPTLTSALSGAASENEDDPFKQLVPIAEEHEQEAHYPFTLDDNYPITTSLFPEDNIGSFY